MKFIHAFLVALALAVTGCGGGSGSTSPAMLAALDTSDLSQRIYVLAGRTGVAGAKAASADYVVTLFDVQREVDWYSDRPERLTGEVRTDHFIGVQWPRVYGQLAPNVLLQYENASGVHGLFGSVHDVKHDAVASTLTFTLRLATSSADVSVDLGAFRSPILTFLNNLPPPQKGSTFALAADRSVLVADGPNRYRLELSGVDKDVFWMNNAPSRAGDFESVGNFVNRWADRFSQALPNASLAGDAGAGDHDIVPLTLSSPRYDSVARTLSFNATPLQGASAPAANVPLSNVVLFVDAGERGTPSDVFAQTWRGVAYSAVPAQFNSTPTGAFFDSDLTADNFQALWGSKNGCGRNDLETMAAAGVNLVRLYDYNFQRGGTKWSSAGSGHIAFLDKAQALGIRVIIPVSNYNFQDQDGANFPWRDIEHTVTQIVESLKKNGAIHPAVHSFSIGNELDLPHYNMDGVALIPRAVRVASLLHRLAPDHYMTVPISNADERRFYAMLRDQLPGDLYRSRFYNAIQTFKPKDGGALENDILRGYDALGYGVPLVITELGANNLGAGSVAAKIDTVIGQASTVRAYLDTQPQSQVKGFAIFEWQNSNWKRGGNVDNTESTFGIHAYGGSLCASSTGRFYMEGTLNNSYVFHEFHADVPYDVDRLVPLTSPAHPQGLLQALSPYFK